MNEPTRGVSAIDRIAERWVDTLVELDPILGTYIGRRDAGDRLPDYSIGGHDRLIDETRRTLDSLRAAVPVDDVDRVTLADLSSELKLSIESHAAGLHLRDLNVIASPAQAIREGFDLMPRADVDDWAQISARLGAVAASLDGYQATLRAGIQAGVVPAVRQVREVASQASRVATDDGFFHTLVTAARADHAELPEALHRDLVRFAGDASRAYAEFSSFLTGELAPHAGLGDAVGREHYELASRGFLGAAVDLDETYEWGIEELARMVAEQESVAREILPGASVDEAIAHLEADPQRKLIGTESLQRWMQETSDRSLAELAETQFEIPDEIRRLECLIAPTNEGGIYYTGPSDDFSRPGRMWWSVPEGVTEFDTWRERTTVYHEGVPGHHLQIGQAVVNRNNLNTWRRQLAGTSGHAEGWALYAERLMEELGYLDDPADRLGMLDGQRMRAARVVVDIGVHLRKQRPDGGGVWTGDDALAFMRDNVNMDDGFVRFEVNRYLGWPGQAPSYKIGQRIWQQLRENARVLEGTAFDIRDFHRRALSLGGVGLDTLRRSLER